MKPNIIPFYGHTGEYGFLSQFYPCVFFCSSVKYNCAEQFMMASKAELFANYDIFYEILKEENPAKIKKYGRMIKNFDQDLWDRKKTDIVFFGNLLKFTQNPILAVKLVQTNGQYLVEASPKDIIWGNGLTVEETRGRMIEDWPGENLLGKTLMKVRQSIKPN